MVYVEGMAGVVTELTFTQEFFDRLDEQLAAEYAESGKQFETLAFSQVRMRSTSPTATTTGRASTGARPPTASRSTSCG